MLVGIGSNLLKQSKASYEESKHSKSPGRKDILSLLVQANTMEDLPVEQRMTDEEVLARMYKPILDRCIFSICSQRYPLSFSLVTKQQGIHIRSFLFRHPKLPCSK